MSTPTATSYPTTSTGARTRTAWYRSGSVYCWALQIVLAAFYVVAALPKLSHDPATLAAFAPMGFGPAGVILIGVVEVAGAIGLLIPRLCGPAATALVAHMTIATVLTVVHFGPAAALMPFATLVAVGVVALYRRQRTAKLVTSILTAVGLRGRAA